MFFGKLKNKKMDNPVDWSRAVPVTIAKNVSEKK